MTTDSPRRRIGLLVDSLVGGGAERIALSFAEAFRRLGHDAHVIIIRNEVEHDTGAVPVHALSDSGALSSYRPVNKLLLARRLRQVVRGIESDGRKFDFFISNAEDMDRLSGLARLPMVLIRYRNAMTPFIGSKIGNTSGLKRRIRTLRWYGKFRRIYGGRHIVTVSKELQREIVEDVGIKPASITTIYNPFDFSRIRRLAEEATSLPDVPYIIYAGRISGRKAQHLLVQAYAKAQVPHKLVLLGGTTSIAERDYERNHLLPIIAQLGLQDRVLLPGFHKNPYPWIKGASLFAMSSLGEGLPTVLIESLILGTPVVSSNCPTGPAEILVGDLAPFLSPVGDVDAMAANIRRALDRYPAIDDALLQRFDDQVSVLQYLAHVDRLTSGNRSS